MKFTVRQFAQEDLKAVLEISILAFTPIHESFENILGLTFLSSYIPIGKIRSWNISDPFVLERIKSIGKDKENFLVAEEDKNVVGFLSYFMDIKKKSGELGINAVHPNHQNKGIGKNLYQHAINTMKENGIKLVEVSTGGDPSHAPACSAYEKCGFTPLPLVRYYKTL